MLPGETTSTLSGRSALLCHNSLLGTSFTWLVSPPLVLRGSEEPEAEMEALKRGSCACCSSQSSPQFHYGTLNNSRGEKFTCALIPLVVPTRFFWLLSSLETMKPQVEAEFERPRLLAVLMAADWLWSYAGNVCGASLASRRR